MARSRDTLNRASGGTSNMTKTSFTCLCGQTSLFLRSVGHTTGNNHYKLIMNTHTLRHTEREAGSRRKIGKKVKTYGGIEVDHIFDMIFIHTLQTLAYALSSRNPGWSGRKELLFWGASCIWITWFCPGA